MARPPTAPAIGWPMDLLQRSIGSGRPSRENLDAANGAQTSEPTWPIIQTTVAG